MMMIGGKVDTIIGFEKEADALEWIKEKSRAWLLEHRQLVDPKPGSRLAFLNYPEGP
jgi:hypothetical protein